MADWYYMSNGTQYGPVTGSQLKSLTVSGGVRPDDLIWKDSMTEWVPARRIRGLEFGLEAPAQAPAQESYRYDAFISYRHVEPDRRWAKWLHSSLETYRVPKQLVRQRRVASRIKRVFRDEEELPASADLNQEIETALRESRFLIVICSPRVVQSQWVNKEVLRFREMGRHNRILALLIEGEPADSFPPALREIRRQITDEFGMESEQIEEIEPLAADVRASRHESRGHLGRMAKFRLLACVLGCRFDDLRQREQERRTRRMAQLGLAALLLVVMMGALAASALVQRERAIKGERSAHENELRAAAKESEANRNATAAERERLDAVAQKSAAEQSTKVARRRLGDLYALEGWTRVQAGDLAIALLWFDRELTTVAGDAEAEVTARYHLGRTLRQLPRPNVLGYYTDAKCRQLLGTLLGADKTEDLLNRSLIAPDSVQRDALLECRGLKIQFKDAQTVSIIDLATGKPLPPILRHKGRINSATFSPDGTRIATAGDDQTAQVWDTVTGEPLVGPLQHETEVKLAAFSPDGRMLLTVGDPMRIGAGSTARIWDATTGRPLTPVMHHAESIRFAAFSLNSESVVTLDVTGTTLVWDLAAGSLTPPMRHTRYVASAVFSTDGRKFVTASHDKTARVWDAATARPLTPPLRHADEVTLAVFSPDGAKIVTECADHTMRVWNAATGEPLTAPVRYDGAARLAALSPDGTKIATAGKDGVARVWEVATGRPLSPPLRHDGRVYFAVFNVDGSRVATTSDDKTARVWDAATGIPLSPPLRHTSRVIRAAFSPDDRKLATTGWDDHPRVWDVVTGKLLATLQMNGGAVGTLIFSPDGRTVLTSTGEEVRIWDAMTGKSLLAPLRRSVSGDLAAFSHDGSKVVAHLDAYAMVRVWDARTGKPLTPPIGDKGGVESAAFSPDDSKLLTGGGAGAVRIWDMSVDDRPESELRRLAEFLAAHRLDETDTPVAMPDAEWRFWWEKLRKDYPNEFVPSPTLTNRVQVHRHEP